MTSVIGKYATEHCRYVYWRLTWIYLYATKEIPNTLKFYIKKNCSVRQLTLIRRQNDLIFNKRGGGTFTAAVCIVCFYLKMNCNGNILIIQGYRGRKKVLKRLTAPKSWMLDKLGGVFVSILMPLRETKILSDCITFILNLYLYIYMCVKEIRCRCLQFE